MTMKMTLLKVGTALWLAALPAIAAAQTAPAAPALTAAPPAAAAAPSVDADPALWAVRDEDTTIYLFGTIHVLKPGLSWFDDAVRRAFDQSDQVVLELVAPEPAAMQGLIMKLAVNPTGPTLTEKLPADKREAYAKAVTGLGLPANAFDRLDPWFASVNLSLLPLQKLGYDPTQGVEAQVSAAAKAAGKPVIGLETAEEQLGFFDALPQPAQVRLLVSTVDELDGLGPMIETMVGAWAKGDPEALGKLMNDSLRESPEVAKVLLNDRNERWADWIEKRLETPGTVFMAVGAGHLAGYDSVLAKLTTRKAKLVRLAY
ncbi:TraB/GumN family protein [Sphingomonas qomolangmaensis]|uniref:TraB/GumN family protein n=1 Tax=Sphingomonas qomolangmaensis TaxID=2918765 RepID=A0ABY5LE38_9SPHN|nr:TraB/GumN family protein [Sphingomonas qomolangmaensis]UUL83958.1 TraB/GumN family protein [Sphingomonas qomolangmaensis]